jgi:phosphoserine aminotransferase
LAVSFVPTREITMQPTVKPKSPNFSSGPCSKRPGYDVAALQLDTLGRSHRSALGKKALGLACSETARILGLPRATAWRRSSVRHRRGGNGHVVPAGARGVDVLAWESFGSGWVNDIVKQLKLPNVNKIEAPYGEMPTGAR